MKVSSSNCVIGNEPLYEIRNPIMLAGEIGRSSNFEFGQSYLTILEIGFITRALKKPTYTTGVRVRQNTLVIAPSGAGKTYLAEQFYKNGIGGVDLFSPDAWKNEHGPRILWLTQGVKWERIRGSFNSRGEVEPPLLCYADIMVAGELLDFLGNPTERSEKIYNLNVATEEGRVSVYQVKGTEIDEEAMKEMQEKCRDVPGFQYDSRLKGFSYKADVSFSGCAHYPEKKIEKEWRDSGYLSRHDTFWWEPGDDELEVYLAAPKVTPNFSKLRPINEAMWRTEFKEIPPPPEYLLQPLRRWLVDEYMKIAKQSGTPLVEFGNLRDVISLTRTMTAFAVARIFETRALDDVTPVETIEYTQLDADMTKRYFMERIGHLAMKVQAMSSDIGGEGCPQFAVSMLDTYLKSLVKEDDEHVSIEHFIDISKTELMKHAQQKQGFKLAHVRNAVSLLKRFNHITYGRGADAIKIDRAFLKTLGFKEDEDTPDHALEDHKATLELEKMDKSRPKLVVVETDGHDESNEE